MHSIIKLFNLFLASVSLCLFICPISGWEVGKLPVASPHVNSISTPWQSHSGTLNVNYTDIYPCDEAHSLTQELPSVWVFISHLYDLMSSSSASSSDEVLKPTVFRQGFIYGATILKILDSDVRYAVLVLIIWCLCAAALVGFVCWVIPPARRPSRDLLGRGSSGCSHRRYRPSQWRRVHRLRPHIVAGLFLKAIWPFLVSFGAFLFNLTKSVGSSTARLLTTTTEPLVKPAADLSHRLGNLLLSSVGTPEETARAFVSLSLAATLCCLFIWIFITLFLKTSDVKRPIVLDMTGGFLVILHTRTTTSGTLDGHGETGCEKLVIPRVWFKHSKDQYETPRVSLLLDVEYPKEKSETKTHVGIPHQPVQNVSEKTEALQELLPTGRSLPKQQSPPSTIESGSFSTLQLSSYVNTSQDLVAQQQSSQKNESCETAVSEQKPAHPIGSGRSTPIQSVGDPEACDGTLLSQKSPSGTEAVVSEPKSSQLFESGSLTTSLQPLLEAEVCDRPSHDKPETIVSELKSPQLNGSKQEKQSQAPLEEEIVSVTAKLNSAQPVGSGSPVPLQPPLDTQTHGEPLLQQLSSQHNDSETSIIEEKTTQAKRSGPLAIQPSLKPNISGRSLSLQQLEQTVGNGSSAPSPSHHKKHERTVLLEQPSNIDGSQDSLHAHSSPPKELRETYRVHIPLQNNLQRNASKRPVLIPQIQIPTGSGGFSSSQTSKKRPVLIQLKPKPIGITFRESVPLNALQNRGYGRFYQQYLQSKRQVNSSFKCSNPVGQRYSSPDSAHRAQNATMNQSSQQTESGKPVLIQLPPSERYNGPVQVLPSARRIASEGSIALSQSIGRNKRSMPVKESSKPNGAGKSKPAQQMLEPNCSKLMIPLLHTPGPLVPMKPCLLFKRSDWVKSVQQSPQTTGIRMSAPVQSTEQTVGSGTIDSLKKSSVIGKNALSQPHSRYNGLCEAQLTEKSITSEGSKPQSSQYNGPTQVQQSAKPTSSEASPRCNGPSPIQQSAKPIPSELFKPSQQYPRYNGPTPSQHFPRYNGPSQIQQSAKALTSEEVSKPPEQSPRYNGPSQIQQSAKPITSEVSKLPQQSPLYNGPSQMQQSAKPITSEEVSKPPEQSPRYNGPSQIQQSAKPITSEVSKLPQQSPLYNGPSQIQQSAKPITSEEVSKPSQQYPRYNGPTPSQHFPRYNGPSQIQQSAKPITSEEVSKPPEQSPRYNGPSQIQQSAKPITSEVSKPSQQYPRYNGPTPSEVYPRYNGPSQIQQSAKPITSEEVSKPPQQSPRYNGPSQIQQSAKPITSEGCIPPKQAPKCNGPTQSAQTFTVDGFMPPYRSPQYNGSTQTQVQKFGQPIPSAGSMLQRQPPRPSRPNGRSLSVSSPVNGPGKSKPEQQFIESNCSKSTPLLQTPAPLVPPLIPMKPRLLFKRSEWANSIQQQPPRTIGSRMPVPMQNSKIPAQSTNDVTPQPQPDPCRKSVPLLQTPKPNEVATPELLERSSSTQLQLVGPGGHTKELTTTSKEGCHMNQLADVKGTQPVVPQDKPIDVGEDRSVSFADGDSLLMTAFIVKNSSRLNVGDSLILPKCCQTKPKSSGTLKGILVEDKSRRRRSTPRPWVEMPSFPPSQAEAVRATKAVNDAKKSRENGLAVERETAAETVASVYNELLQIPAGLTICHFETE